MTASATQELCVACGLCCDRSLFDGLPLSPDESVTMTRLGVPVVTHGERDFLVQPCAALERAPTPDGGEAALCRVYAERPRCCADYHCRLLVAVQIGMVTLERAHATVRMAKELVEPQRAQFLDYHFRLRTHYLGKPTP